MGDERLTIETGDDAATRHMARMLLIAEIATQVLTAFMVLEMIDHGDISYRIAWYWNRLKQRVASQRDAEQRLRADIGRMLYEAQTIVEGSNG